MDFEATKHGDWSNESGEGAPETPRRERAAWQQKCAVGDDRGGIEIAGI